MLTLDLDFLNKCCDLESLSIISPDRNSQDVNISHLTKLTNLEVQWYNYHSGSDNGNFYFWSSILSLTNLCSLSILDYNRFVNVQQYFDLYKQLPKIKSLRVNNLNATILRT